MSLTIILKAIELGLIFSILSLGVYISFRVLNVRILQWMALLRQDVLFVL